MKKLFKVFSIIVIIYFVGITIIKSIASAVIERETILLEQENKLLWVDAIENYEYYDAVEALYENNLLIEE